MKKFLTLLLVSIFLLGTGAFTNTVKAETRTELQKKTSSKSSSKSSKSKSSKSGKTVRVKSYTKKDGTHVKAHTRKAPSKKK